MAERTCDFLCFQECGEKYDQLIMKREVQNVQKLSLKKLSLQHNHGAPRPHRQLQKSPSYKRIQHYRNRTDRSRQDQEQDLAMFRKKVEIEKEIKEVNQSILHLNDAYHSKIKMLKSIKYEMNEILRKGNQ